MVWNTSFDGLHKSLNRDLLNKVANFLDQIPELDDVIFDTVEGKIAPNRLIEEEVQKYEKLLIKNKILPQDKIKSMEYALIKVLKPKYNLAGNKYKYHW